MTAIEDQWLNSMKATIASYRKMIDATIEQLSDEELMTRPAPNINSVAIILRHLGGNLQSRWTDFLTTDGEKPSRNRDTEFAEWEGDRASLMSWFDAGWNALNVAISEITPTNISTEIFIRGESHTIAQAITRSITHLTYHVGQITLISRMVHQGDWKWLTIAPGQSQTHNDQTWGTAATQSIFAKESEDANDVT